MSFVLRRSAVLLFLFLVIKLPAQDSLKVLSLQESIDIALNNATAIIKGKNAVDISGAQVMSAYGQFLPDVNFNGAYTYTDGDNLLTVTAPTLVSSQRTNIAYQLVSSINIYNGFANRASLKAALLNKEIAGLSLERARQQITLDITQTYLQVILDQQIVAFAKQNVQTSSKRENQLQELVGVGRRAQSDLFQQQSQTSLDQQFLINAENKLLNDKIILLQKLRINTTDPYDFADIVVDENPLGAEYINEQALVEKATAQRYDLKAAQRSQDAALLYIQRYRSGYLPRVSLNAGAYGISAHFNKLDINGVNSMPSEQRSWGTQLGDQIYGVVALNVGWTLFDKNITRSNVAIARINATNARVDYENVNLQIVSEVRQALGNYRAALQQTVTSQKGLDAAQQAYDALNSKYSVGSANFIELSNAQNNLLLAKQNRAQASISLHLQKKAIDYYLGN
jgi:outer membrane protein